MRSKLLERLRILTTTDMALIVSPAQNEIERMKKHGLDIVPHRQRMNEEEVDEKFKDTTDPLRLVFVCALWLAGFDAPSCYAVYLDKPMRNVSRQAQRDGEVGGNNANRPVAAMSDL